MAEYKWPVGGSGAGIKKVADATARLALVPNDGDVVIQLDTDAIWSYDATGLVWVLQSVGGGYGKMFTNAADTVAGYLDDELTVSTGLTKAITGTTDKKVQLTNSDTGSAAVSTHEGTYVHSDIALNTSARHAAVTISTANGLSILAQALSLGLASSGVTGALSGTDWTTFNAKEPALTKGNLSETTSSVLTISSGTNAVIGTGTTIEVKQAGAAQSGYLSSTDWGTFNGKQGALSFGNLTETTSSVLTIGSGTGAVIGSGTTITVAQSGSGTSGYLSSTDWSTFNGKAPSGASYLTATAEGGLSAEVNLGALTTGLLKISVAAGVATPSTASSGTDYEPPVTKGNLTEATSSILTITGGTGAVIGSGTTVEVKQAATAQSGYLSSTDWNTFSGKQDRIRSVVTKTADYTATTSDDVILLDGSSATVNITLYTTTSNSGRMLTLICTGAANECKVSTVGGNQLNGDTVYYFTGLYDKINIVTNGTDWFIM